MSVVHDPSEVGKVPYDAEVVETHLPSYVYYLRCYDCGAERVRAGGFACIRDTPSPWYGLGKPDIIKSWNLCVPCMQRRRTLQTLTG